MDTIKSTLARYTLQLSLSLTCCLCAHVSQFSKHCTFPVMKSQNIYQSASKCSQKTVQKCSEDVLAMFYDRHHSKKCQIMLQIRIYQSVLTLYFSGQTSQYAGQQLELLTTVAVTLPFGDWLLYGEGGTILPQCTLHFLPFVSNRSALTLVFETKVDILTGCQVCETNPSQLLFKTSQITFGSVEIGQEIVLT